MRTLVLILLGFSSSMALAEFEKHSPQSIDFNKMIESNSGEVHKMKKDISKNGFGSRPKVDSRNADSKKVVDFLDVEVGWGETPKVVDRRFNSVDEPKVVLRPASSI